MVGGRVPRRLSALLAARGVATEATLARWFARTDPTVSTTRRLLPDADRLLERLTARPVERAERVLVFGDFDADGLTGLAIMTIALRRFGLEVIPYVPEPARRGTRAVARRDRRRRRGRCHRHRHGRLRLDQRGRDRRRRGARDRRHRHRPPSRPAGTLPAIALVNPHRPDAVYPDRRLAGSGVAFKVAQLLLADLPGGPAAALDLADLATIGTVADVAPVVGENRAIARLGLERLRTAPRPGIAALLERARVAPAAVDLETVAFAIAPRLNAAGRVGEASRGRTPPSGRGSRRGRRPRRRPRGGQPRPAGPDEGRGRRGPGRGRRRTGRRGGRLSRTVGRRDRRACRGPAGRGVAVDQRSSAPISATSSGPRAGATAAWISARRSSPVRTCSSATAVTLGRPGSRSRPTGGRRSAIGSSSAAATAPADPRVRRVDRPGPARARRGLRPVPGAGGPRPVRTGQPGSARRRARAGRDPRPRRHRWPQPADPAARPGRARRHRLRPKRHRRDRPRGRRLDVVARLTSRIVRRLRVAPARHPRRRDVRVSSRGGPDPGLGRGPSRGRCRSPEPERSMSHPAGSRPREDDRLQVLRPLLAPTLAVVGLLIVAFLTLQLMNGSVPFVGGSGGSGARETTRGLATATGTGTPARGHPGPIEHRRRARQARGQVTGLDRLREGGQHLDPDRQAGPPADRRRPRFDAVLVAGRQGRLLRPDDGRDRHLALAGRRPPLPDDGPGRHARQGRRQRGPRQSSSTGTISVGSRDWFSWIRQPVLGPDGRTLALVSDGPDPSKSDVVLQFYDLPRKKRTVPTVIRDPAARPPGSGVAA